jgi:hypothetical protein
VCGPVRVYLYQIRTLLAVLLALLLPLSLFADDTSAAILLSNGGVLRNQNEVPASIALFSGDTIQTQPNATARIALSGATVEISPETVIVFHPDEIVLDHGSILVNTSRQLRVRTGCVLSTPVRAEWTLYNVTDINGKVTVAARKSDVYLDARSRNLQPATQTKSSERTIVHESEQKSREEKCGGADLKQSPLSGASGDFLNSPYAVGAGVAAVIGLTCWALCRSDNPLSPSMP